MGYARIFLAVLYLAVCFEAEQVADYYLAAGLIAISMVTDFLDGKIARRFHMVTRLGKVLDPLADKITLGAVALSFVLRYPLAEKVVCFFFIKEGFMLAAGGWMTRYGWRTEGALFCGKVCTASMYGVSVLLLAFPEMMPAAANGLLLAELVVMAFTLAFYVELYACAARKLREGVLPEQVSLRKIQREKKERRRRWQLVWKAAVPVFLVYLAVGAVYPYMEQPEISEAAAAAFDAAEYYGGGQTRGSGSSDLESGEPEERKQSLPAAKTGNTCGDRARIIDDNGEALDARLQMISHAKKRVILSTFDFRDDEAGLTMLAVLLDAAERGVSVEIFADGFNSWIRMEGNPNFYALSSHPNVKIIVYNKVNLLKPWTAMGRMHDKYVIVDETAYLLGGRNTFGYFLGDYEGHKNYDWDVLVYNAAAKETGEASARDQESSLYQVLSYYEKITAQDCCTLFHKEETIARKPSVRRARARLERRLENLKGERPELFEAEYEYETGTEPTEKITLLSNPTHTGPKEPTVFYGLMELAARAEGEVVIHTPYILCGDDMYAALAELGQKVTLMFNSAANNGNPFAAVDYLTQKQRLIDTGVTLLEYEGGISYHGKVMTMGEELAMVGSFNMDMRSAYLDTELMLVIDSPAVNRSLREKMERYEAEAATVETVDTYSRVPEGLELQEISGEKLWMKKLLGGLLERLRFLL